MVYTLELLPTNVYNTKKKLPSICRIVHSLMMIMMMMMMMMMMMNYFCGMVDRRMAFSLISSRDHYQRSSPPRNSDTSRPSEVSDGSYCNHIINNGNLNFYVVIWSFFLYDNLEQSGIQCLFYIDINDKQ